ncbi:MAG: hypothetical protein IK127_04600 [Clostridia bacterium]|nr:hypothetical protein [Clostridia bacterium]
MRIFKNIVLTVLCVAMLASVALAVPRGDLNEKTIAKQVADTRDEELSFLDDLWGEDEETTEETEEEEDGFSWDDEEEDPYAGYFD